jgi:hypothetical protein
VTAAADAASVPVAEDRYEQLVYVRRLDVGSGAARIAPESFEETTADSGAQITREHAGQIAPEITTA